MSPERNEPCTCGTVSTDPVALNREAAYAGDIGCRRRQFCLDYTLYKKATLTQGENMLREMVASRGDTISCRKGCPKCCRLYVTATLQEAECITYFLYQHETVLQHFITAYRDWERALGLFDHKRLDQAMARNLAGELSAREIEQLGLQINDYTRRRISCPFLLDNACSIYELRPFVCAGVVAVTPTEMCTFDGTGINQARYCRIDFDPRQDMPYFLQARARNHLVFGCMPELVHRIVKEGYSFLATIDGLEEFRQQDAARCESARPAAAAG